MSENPCRRVDVTEMAGDERRWVERLLGQSLHEDQQVYILAFRPGVLPDENARRRELANMQQTFTKAEQHAQQQGTSDAEIDDAVEEATDRVRYGTS